MSKDRLFTLLAHLIGLKHHCEELAKELDVNNGYSVLLSCNDIEQRVFDVIRKLIIQLLGD